MIKRGFDLAVVIALAPFAAVVILIALIVVRADSRGPAIFRQERVGRNEQSFVCLKLRTMRTGTPDLPSHQIGASSVTRVGHVLRRTKIDELPQLWNIITGDMSLVGPRPCLPTQTQLIEARRRHGLFRIRPGITGVAQVAGVDMSDPERLATLDATYLNDMSLGRDIGLIAATIVGAGRGDRVDASG